jgi:hypothetical protein
MWITESFAGHGVMPPWFCSASVGASCPFKKETIMNERKDAVSPADKLVTLTDEELAGVSGGDVKPTEQH